LLRPTWIRHVDPDHSRAAYPQGTALPTGVGQELLRLEKFVANEPYLKDLANLIKQDGMKILYANLHQRDGGEIRYSDVVEI
jgi:hypothetical protein